MTIQLEMGKCQGCETYFWKRVMKDNKCNSCQSIPIPKQVVAQTQPVEQNQQTTSDNNVNQS